MPAPKRLVILVTIVIAILFVASCHRTQTRERTEVRLAHRSPNSAETIDARDVGFYSTALGRQFRYRIWLPVESSGLPRTTVYLLHGREGSREDINKFGLEELLQSRGFIVVMPDAGNSYYTNSYWNSSDRYDDAIVRDLITDVEQHYPAARTSSGRVVAGISMGGYGAVKFGLKYPDVFANVVALSTPADVTERTFTLPRAKAWWHLAKIFGPPSGSYRRENDLFELVRRRDPRLANQTRFALGCGASDPLLDVNRRLARAMGAAKLNFNYSETVGGHEWTYWSREMNNSLSQLPSADGR